MIQLVNPHYDGICSYSSIKESLMVKVESSYRINDLLSSRHMDQVFERLSLHIEPVKARS